MPLIRPKPPTRRPGLGAAKLVLAAIAAGVGASLLFHSTVGSPPALVQPAVPEDVVAAPTVQAGESAVEALEPQGVGGAAAPATADQGPGSKKRQDSHERTGEPRTTLTRSSDRPAQTPAETPAAPPEPLAPADPAPVEQPEPRDEPRSDAPSAPVELPPDEASGKSQTATTDADGTAPPPPPTTRAGG
jgi:hypothetical protein